MLTVGTIAPDFSLPDQNGEIHTLSQYRGQKVILYFYPKDQTAGCIKEACSFRDRMPQFTEKGAVKKICKPALDATSNELDFDFDHDFKN